MKKILSVTILLATFFASAQETEETKPGKNPKLDFYWGLGVNYNPYQLNDKLKTSGVAEINETMPEFLVGMNVFGEKISGDMEFGLLYSRKSSNDNKTHLLGGDIRLRVHYNLVATEKMAFTTGLSFSAVTNTVDIYNDNNVIDLNNLDPMSNVGHISLRNQVFYAGPSVSFYALRHKKINLRLNVGYEFAFTNGKWKSDFAEVRNTVKEVGNNRLVVGFVFQ